MGRLNESGHKNKKSGAWNGEEEGEGKDDGGARN